MAQYQQAAQLQVDEILYQFIEQTLIPNHPHVESASFWQGFSDLVHELAPVNKALLEKRDAIQAKMDDWCKQNPGAIKDQAAYQAFLKDIGYLVEEPADFSIATQNVDLEIAEQAGPQLVVPINNARYAINAANARWGSLYDALYGTNAISQAGDLAVGKEYNSKRGAAVIEFARNFLDQAIPLSSGSHKDTTAYAIVNGEVEATLQDGSKASLQNPALFVAYTGDTAAPASLLFLHNGLHFDVVIDKTSAIGAQDPAGIKDVIM